MGLPAAITSMQTAWSDGPRNKQKRLVEISADLFRNSESQQQTHTKQSRGGIQENLLITLPILGSAAGAHKINIHIHSAVNLNRETNNYKTHFR